MSAAAVVQHPPAIQPPRLHSLVDYERTMYYDKNCTRRLSNQNQGSPALASLAAITLGFPSSK